MANLIVGRKEIAVETKEIKFCKDCKWAVKTRLFSWKGAICSFPSTRKAAEYNLVTGKMIVEASFPSAKDQRDLTYECGPEAKRFAPKDKFKQVLQKLDKE